MNEAEVRRRIEQYRHQKQQHERSVDLYAGAIQALRALLRDNDEAETSTAPRILDLEKQEPIDGE